MKNVLHQTRLSFVSRQRNGYLVLALGLLVLCGVLIVWLLCHTNQERIVLVPAGFTQTAWVGESHVSASYLSQMSMMLANLRLNLTPETVMANHQRLLAYVDSAYFGELQQVLLSESARLKQTHMATAFYVTRISVDALHFMAYVEGKVVSMVGNAVISEKSMQYELRYHYRDGQLFLKAFIGRVL